MDIEVISTTPEEELELPVCPQCGGGYEGDLIEVQVWVEAHWQYENTEVCEACADADFVLCADCSSRVESSGVISVGGDSICRCCRDNYNGCNGCGNYVRHENSYYDENSDADYCEHCYCSQVQSRSGRVRSYGYSPNICFYDADGGETSSRNGFFHGLEIETGWKVGERSGYAEQVMSALGEVCYLKEDSSITDNRELAGGFEIVTHPCHLGWYRNNIRRICDGAIPGLLSHDVGEGIGLHISANRNALTNHAVARICAFIGADRNESWLVRMARRKSDQWAQIVKKTCVADTLEIIGGQEYLKVNEHRYEAVNLQNDSHIEFRLFRGTLKYASVMLCIEFVNALCRWCMEPAEVADYQSATSLLAFATNDPAAYPHLIAFLRDSI